VRWAGDWKERRRSCRPHRGFNGRVTGDISWRADREKLARKQVGPVSYFLGKGIKQGPGVNGSRGRKESSKVCGNAL